MAAIKALELWCKIHCDGYRDVSITNMTTSFRNGLAFCALIHQHRPDLIDYDSLRKEDVLENNRLAFQVAEEKLGIPALLDAEDMVALKIPDRLSVLTYVSQYYNYFNGRNAMGGVKRPAEGAKEELADRKKNLPLSAKTFVSKTATENREPPRLKARTPPLRSAGTGSAGTGSAGTGSAGTAAQNPISAENSHKTETLSSKCVACKSHVHLVQRHFVEGKLYHRSCFRCCDCSSTLHAGSYKPGKAPDTFTCKVHHNSSSSDAGTKNAPTTPAPAPRSLSVLSAPLRFTVKSLAPSPSFPSWTASAQKTQSARRKFFQSAPRPEPQTTARKLSENTRDSGKPDTARTKLAEENFNNNNKRLFSVRPAERRFGQEPAVANSLSLRNADSSQDPAGRRAEWRAERRAEQPSSRQTNNQEFPRLTVVDKDAAGPTSVHAAAADPDQERKPEAPNIQKDPQDAESQVCDPGFMVQTSKVSVSEMKPPLVPAPSGQTGRAAVSVSVALFNPSQLRETSQKTAERCLKPEPPSPVKSPPRRPAEESISSSTPASNPSRAKKGKYLSPTNASRSEMRSPSVKPYHVAAAAAAQIEKELNDIEMNLARLEKEGVELEKKLRRCEDEGDGDVLMDPLMVDWFNLIQKKQMFIRKESELVYTARTQELEQQQPGVEGELRRLMEKPDHLKSREEQQQEQTLMLRLMEIVDDRNAIVENLDEDRLREVEEDQQLNEMMKNLGVKRGKTKRKSSVSKLFRRRSKRQVE